MANLLVSQGYAVKEKELKQFLASKALGDIHVVPLCAAVKNLRLV